MKTKAPNNMALRDWFAGQALPSLITKADLSFENLGKTREVYEKNFFVAMHILSRNAYAVADAMLAQQRLKR